MHSSQMIKLASLPSKMLPTNGRSARFFRSRSVNRRTSTSESDDSSSSLLLDEDEVDDPDEHEDASDSFPLSSSVAKAAVAAEGGETPFGPSVGAIASGCVACAASPSGRAVAFRECNEGR